LNDNFYLPKSIDILTFPILAQVCFLFKTMPVIMKYVMKKTFESEKFRFPIGKFVKPKIYTVGQINKWIEEIEHFPARIYSLVTD